MLEGDLLEVIADRLGVEVGYHAINGDFIAADDDAKRAVLKGFGIDVQDPHAAAAQLTSLERAAARLLPKTLVATCNESIEIKLQKPIDQPTRDIPWRLDIETGDQRSGEIPSDGTIIIPQGLPEGYHQLTLQLTANIEVSCRLIIVPETATALPRPVCGLTVPLYGLKSERNWGVGDYEDLARFAESAAPLGVDFVGVNPVHALFPKAAEHFSPYSPSSRRYLNVMLIAPDMIPELYKAPKGKAVLKEITASREFHDARDDSLVDYKMVYTLKWRALNVAFRIMEGRKPSNSRLKAFNRFVETEGEALRRHALYETIADFIGSEKAPSYDWRDWPSGLHDPASKESAAFAEKHSSRVRFYCFIQWLAHEQLTEAQRRAKAAGMCVGLYLDIAVGMVPGGAEAWGSRDEVAQNVSLGAPGDAANPDGQMWNLTPLDPHAMLENGFNLLRQTLKATMNHAGMVRIDHILGVNRSFWAPIDGGSEGAYVRYPTKEILGIIALESKRSGCIVIGEDLGIVPPGFGDLLRHHGLYGCTLFPFARREGGIFCQSSEYEKHRLASLGNHDFPTIRGYWEGADLDVRQKLGIGASEGQIAHDLYMRDRDREAVLQLLVDEGLLPEGIDPAHPPREFLPSLNEALHRFIGRTRSEAIALQLEDLLSLREQSNLPGTTDEYPNWRRKIDLPIEQIFKNDDVQNLLQAAVAGRCHAEPELRKTA